MKYVFMKQILQMQLINSYHFQGNIKHKYSTHFILRKNKIMNLISYYCNEKKNMVFLKHLVLQLYENLFYLVILKYVSTEFTVIEQTTPRYKH